MAHSANRFLQRKGGMRKENERKERNNRIGIGIILILIFIFTGVTNMSAVGFLGFGDTANW